MTTYERVKAVMETFGWEPRGEHHWSRSGSESICRSYSNPLTPDVVRAIEQGMVDKGWWVYPRQSLTHGFACGVHRTIDDQIWAEGYDTYGMAQLECAEMMLGLEVEG